MCGAPASPFKTVPVGIKGVENLDTYVRDIGEEGGLGAIQPSELLDALMLRLAVLLQHAPLTLMACSITEEGRTMTVVKLVLS